MPRTFGAGFLGELGTRLQRLLGFDGEPGASFTAQAVPVLIVGDGTMPGYGDQQGRRWAAMSPQMPAGIIQTFWLRSTTDQIIERIVFYPTDANIGPLMVGQSANTLAEPGGVVTAQGTFCDRMISRDDRPPIRGSMANFVLDVNRFQMVEENPGVKQHVPVQLVQNPFCLRAENPLFCSATGPAGKYVVWGRTL